MKTTPFLALIALLVTGTAQAQTLTQAPKTATDYFLTKATLTLVNGVVPSPVLPPHAIGRFPGDKLTIELGSASGGGFNKTWQLANLVSGLQLPATSEVLSLKPAPGIPNQDSRNNLQNYHSNGLVLRIAYVGAVPTNAWQLSGATLAMEFRDSSGAFHPQNGSVTVKFPTNNARIGFNPGDDILSAAKHKDTAYLRTGLNFKPEAIKLATN